MRLWSLHPRFLDQPGLGGLWREGLLAQKVLQGQTKGYKNHPQLERFKATKQPLVTIATYLTSVWLEADRRGYEYDESKIVEMCAPVFTVPVTQGQLVYEWQHLLAKLKRRSPEWYEQVRYKALEPHPMFGVIPGEIESWERVGSTS